MRSTLMYECYIYYASVSSVSSFEFDAHYKITDSTAFDGVFLRRCRVCKLGNAVRLRPFCY